MSLPCKPEPLDLLATALLERNAVHITGGLELGAEADCGGWWSSGETSGEPSLRSEAGDTVFSSRSESLSSPSKSESLPSHSGNVRHASVKCRACPTEPLRPPRHMPKIPATAPPSLARCGRLSSRHALLPSTNFNVTCDSCSQMKLSMNLHPL